MKLRKRMILKIVAGVLLFFASLGFAYIIKDTLSERTPLNALPDIKIIYNDEQLPREHIQLAAYSWRFLNRTQADVLIEPEGWRNINPAPVLPGASLEIQFSYACKDLKISRAEWDSGVFHEVSTIDETNNQKDDSVGRLRTPSEPGTYVYRVEAGWGVRGSVQYYFVIRIGE